MTVPSWEFTKIAPTFAFAAEFMTLGRMKEAVCSGPLGVGAPLGSFKISGVWSIK